MREVQKHTAIGFYIKYPSSVGRLCVVHRAGIELRIVFASLGLGHSIFDKKLLTVIKLSQLI